MQIRLVIEFECQSMGDTLEVKNNLKLKLNDSTQMYDYVLVDKDEHIRAHCSINDAKVARDIPKMFKLLNNQYVPRKLDIKQIKK